MGKALSGRERALVRSLSWGDVSAGEYDRILAIRESAFPPSERFPSDTVACRDGDWLWVATVPGRGIVGFATGLVLRTAGVMYLEYLAVDARLRGGGIGAMMLASISRDLRSDVAVRGVVLEVEDPHRMVEPDPMPARRLAFYDRWGARPVDCLKDYSMPDLADPGERVPMLLLWHPTGGVDEPDGAQVRRILTDLYRGYYAPVAPPGFLAEMLAKIVP